MKERENLHDILRESSFNMTRGGAMKIFRHPKGGLRNFVDFKTNRRGGCC